jgi:hypothetical protein
VGPERENRILASMPRAPQPVVGFSQERSLHSPMQWISAPTIGAGDEGEFPIDALMSLPWLVVYADPFLSPAGRKRHRLKVGERQYLMRLLEGGPPCRSDGPLADWTRLAWR